VKRNVESLQDGTFDLLILGGGITGAGVALDAVLRGLRVALIDKGDFASATSSASSKLVHGGLRYLEHGHIPLVYEALHERRILLKNAPHLVQPLPFIIPFYQRSRVPGWRWRAGLTLYDLLAGAGNLHRSRPLTARRLLRQFPGLRAAGLRGGAEYYDAQMDDARLCLEVVRTAAVHGACVANYAEAVAFEKSGDRIVGVQALDQVTGHEFAIQARQVLNATGPWVDAICRLAGDLTSPHLRPTKGVHLVVPDRQLQAAFLLLHPVDGRVFFVIPWMGKTLIGTTDTLYEESPDEVAVILADITYLLEGYNHHFAPPLTSSDVLSSFAGLRPLIRAKPGSPSSLSREFRLFDSPSGLLSVAGGKYTTYRRMAESITDVIARRLRCRQPSKTREFALDGTPRQPWPVFVHAEMKALEQTHQLSKEAARHLVQRYGRRAAAVAAYLHSYPALAEPVIAGEPDLKVEFVYQREHEMAVDLTDFLLRRTRLGLFRPELLQKSLRTLE
jgi:glycerol-3-phosphate dehydrogenase